MSEYLHVEQSFLTQLGTLGWEVVDLKFEVRSVKGEIAHGGPADEGLWCDGAMVSSFKLHPSNFMCSMSGFPTSNFTLQTSAMKGGR